MPVSALQHKTSSGIHQNKLYHNVRSNKTSILNKVETHTIIPDELSTFGYSIRKIINAHIERRELSSPNKAPSHNILVPALLLLSQLRPVDCPPDKPSYVYNQDSACLTSDNTTYSDNSTTHFNILNNSVVNTLYKSGGIIPRYKPLTFPNTSTVSLPVANAESENTPDGHFSSRNLSQKINNLISILNDSKEKIEAKKIANKLDIIAIKAEKAFSSSPKKYKNFEDLIYLKDNSNYHTNKFDINHGLNCFGKTPNAHKKRYIKMANNIPDDRSILVLKKYLKALSALTFTPGPGSTLDVNGLQKKPQGSPSENDELSVLAHAKKLDRSLT